MLIRLSNKQRRKIEGRLKRLPDSFWEEVRLQTGEIEIINDRLVHYGYGETAQAVEEWLGNKC